MSKPREGIEWRIIPSYPELMASSDGKIMRIPHFKEIHYGGKRQYGGFPTIGQWSDTRYIYIHRGKSLKVSRLVCEAFHGPAPEGKNVCMHLDENSKNNRPENLKWGTQKENLNFPGFLKYCASRTGENSPFIKGRKVK